MSRTAKAASRTAYVYPRNVEQMRRLINQSPLTRAEIAYHAGCSRSRISYLATQGDIGIAIPQALTIERLLGAPRGSLFALGGGTRAVLSDYLPTATAGRTSRKRLERGAAA